MTNKPNTDKTIEQIRDELAEELSKKTFPMSFHKDERSYARYISRTSFDAAIKLCEQRDRDLVEALEFADMAIDHALGLGYVGEGSTNGMFKDALKRSRLSLKKHRGENENK